MNFENDYKRLSEINKSGEIGTWSFDVVNEKWDFSETTIKILGIKNKKDFKLVDMFPLINKEDLDKIIDIRKKALENKKKEFAVKFAVNTKEKETRNFSAWGLIKLDSDKTVLSIYGGLKDITKQVQREQEVLTANRYLSIALDSNKESLWETIVGEKKTTTIKWYDSLGYKAGKKHQLDHLTWEDLLHPIDKKRAIDNFNSFLNGTNKEYKDKFRLKKSDGSYTCIQTTGYAVELTKNGTPYRIVGVHSDISDAMKMQRALRKSQQRLDLLVQNVADTVIQTTQEGIVEFASDNFYLLTGKNKNEKISIFECIYSIDRETIRDHIENLKPYPHTNIVISRLLSEDKYVWFEWRIKRIFETEENKHSLIFIGHDITSRLETEHKVLESEANLRMMVNNAKDFLLRIDKHNKLSYASENAYKVLGLEKEELIGSYPSIFIYEDDIRHIGRSIKELRKNIGKDMHIDSRVITKDGVRWYEWIARAIENNGEIICIGRDTTDAISKQNEIERLVTRLDTTLEAAKIATWDWNIIENTITFSAMLFKMLEREIVPESKHSFAMLNEWIYPDDLKDILNLVNGKILKNEDIIEDRFRCLNGKGEYIWIQSRGYVTEHDEHGKISRALGVYILIDEQQKLEDKLSFLAYHDELTGLFNRERITEILALYDKSDKKIKAAGIYLDLDNFKATNDIYGHAAGDVLLQSTAKTIEDRMGNDGYCARLSGDEFFIFLPCYESKKHVIEFAKNLLNFLGSASSYSIPHDIAVSTSAGIVFYPDDTDDIKALINYSDVAMLQAKEKGKNRYVLYNGKETQQYYRNHKLLHDIRRAIKEEEFILYYQPVIDLTDLKIVGIEALIRWNHPKYGIVLPSEFLHVAEISGEISNISKLTFKLMMEQMKIWHEQMDEKISVSINLSAKQLTDTNLSEYLIKIMNECGVSPKNVIFEITEVSLLNLVATAKSNLDVLANKGCKIALDDFGIEYSSLSMLEKIKFDIIKIDQYFISTIKESFVSRQVISMIYNIVNGLNKRCIVEGVETKEQLEMMKDIGFKYIQGFYFSKPLSVKKIEKYIKKHGTKNVI